MFAKFWTVWESNKPDSLIELTDIDTHSINVKGSLDNCYFNDLDNGALNKYENKYKKIEKTL
jgi:hypothetical protein